MRLIDRLRAPGESPRASAVQLQTMFQQGVDSRFADHMFETYAVEGLMDSGPIYALIAIRAAAFSEMEPKWQNEADLRLFGTEALSVLERPLNGSRRTLLKQVEVDISLAGNAYVLRPRSDRRRLQRLRPDWVKIVSIDGTQIDGYLYEPLHEQPTFLALDEVAHVRGLPDPLHPWRGMSWITAVAREADGDTEMSRHKTKFFQNAATPNLIVKFEGELHPDTREVFRSEFDRRYAGVQNAFKTLLLDRGADVEAIGHSMEQNNFSVIQAAGEARMAAAANVPAQIAGFSKGLDSSTYTNYTQAMRRFADLYARPAWGDFCEAMERILPPPPGARLWYADRNIPFLQQDAKDEADIRNADARTLRELVSAGFDPDTAREAVVSGDFSLLTHTGLTSVQLQPPQTEGSDDE